MAASLALSFGSNSMKVRHHFSSHPEDGEKLGWNSLMESPQLSRYAACACGRGWPYHRGGSATLKSSLPISASISFLSLIHILHFSY